jgi:hypothetical protein
MKNKGILDFFAPVIAVAALVAFLVLLVKAIFN